MSWSQRSSITHRKSEDENGKFFSGRRLVVIHLTRTGFWWLRAGSEILEMFISSGRKYQSGGDFRLFSLSRWTRWITGRIRQQDRWEQGPLVWDSIRALNAILAEEPSRDFHQQFDPAITSSGNSCNQQRQWPIWKREQEINECKKTPQLLA